MFCSPNVAMATKWRVYGRYTHSDHLAVNDITGWRARLLPEVFRLPAGVLELDKDLFIEVFHVGNGLINLNPEGLITSLTRVFDEVMPKKTPPRNAHRPIYWWNEQISLLYQIRFRARRRIQWASGEIILLERREAFRSVRLHWGAKSRIVRRTASRNCITKRMRALGLLWRKLQEQ